MLKTITKSSNRKLGGCAATYRSGTGDVYSTCPSGCPLKPEGHAGSENIDTEYLRAVLDAVPEGGVSWTYTHFPKDLIPLPEEGKTTINISTDSHAEAKSALEAGYPVVTVRPISESEKVDRVDGVRYVRCPAEYSDINCSTCGSGKPLCARQGRDYVIKFTAHGNQAKRIQIRVENQASQTQPGGCYGSGGPVHLQWKKTMGETANDAEQLKSFVRTLPRGTILRHHVVGDIGA